MKKYIVGIFFLLFSISVNAQLTVSKELEQEVLALSSNKWLWMAEQKVDSLAVLFHPEAVFVHMGATMTKDQELRTIKSGVIQYKYAAREETTIRFIGNTAIILDKIRLTAIVGNKDVINPFMVTEVYVQLDGDWKLGSLSFTRLLGD